MNSSQGRWLVGALAALSIFVCLLSFAGLAFMGPRFGGLMMYRAPVREFVQPNAPPIAPDDQPRVFPDGRRGFDNRYDGYAPYGYRGWGGFGFIGGIFRALFTLAFILFLIWLVSRLFWRRGWAWGSAPGWHGGPRGDAPIPSWAEDWHRKMHEKMDTPNASSEQKPSEPMSETKPVVETRDDNPPVTPTI
jgi:hypothetical protein